MPGGEFTIERRKLRGEVSDGMILSERELELGSDHGGIMVLPDSLEAGTPLSDVLPLGDDILEIETLYNRPDLTSIYGIAREVAVLTGSELRPPPGTDPAREGDEPVDIRVEDLQRCPRYIGRLFRDVRLGESPAWLKARLIGAGMRPISNVVDVTNYVMLALGSPLHAFDFDSLAEGRIVVRRARPGEALETLDGTERELDPEDLVIADAERPIAIGGVMGGANDRGRRRYDVGAARGGELRAADRDAERRAPSHAHREPDALGEGRRPGGCGPRGDVRLAAPRRARRVALDGRGGGARRDRGAGGARVPPEPYGRGLGWRCRRPSSAIVWSGSGSSVTGDWRVQTPTWRARDVRREIDLVEEVARFRLEDVPAVLPPPPRDVRAQSRAV